MNKTKLTTQLGLLIIVVMLVAFAQPLANTPGSPISTLPQITTSSVNTKPLARATNKPSASQNNSSKTPSDVPQQTIYTSETFVIKDPLPETRNQDFIVADDGTIYPNQRYSPSALTNDTSAGQWWESKVGLTTAWDYGVGSRQTVLAIIDTGFALNHEEFANRLYENVGEKGPTTQQQASKLNCTQQGLPLNKSCNVIDDNFDGIIDNELGTTTLENRSLLNCSDQSLAIDKSCNMIDDDGNGLIDDVRGWDYVNYDRSVQAGETNLSGSGTTHGTQVAGVAAATGNNSKGIAGVDWYTKILPIQALDDDGYGDTLTVSRSIRYAADRGADVINISLGSAYPDAYLRQAIAYAISKGSIIVAAAGNEGCQCLSYPARYEEVVAVGASDMNDIPTSFSNWGDTLDILAPGINITSPTWTAGNQNSAYSSGLAGTSFSTPLVAGLLTLARSHQPQASAGQLIAALTEQTNRLSLASNQPRTANLGYGRADAAVLLSRVKAALSPVQRYAFSPISGGNLLAAYEPPKPFYAYACETTRPGTTPVYRLSKAATIFYTTSEVERYQAIAQGYVSNTFGSFCINLPTDQPQSVRSLFIPAEFENRPLPKF